MSSENDDVWGGAGRMLGGGGALEPALTRPTFRSSRWPSHEPIQEACRSTYNANLPPQAFWYLHTDLCMSTLRHNPQLPDSTCDSKLHIAHTLPGARVRSHHDIRQPALLAGHLPRKRRHVSHRPIPLPGGQFRRSRSGRKAQGRGREGKELDGFARWNWYHC